MIQKEFKLDTILSAIIAVLAGVTSVTGFFTNLYRDNMFVIGAFRGNDLVTLFLVIPLLVATVILTQRGSQRAHLIWMGCLGYMLYNYMFYLYGTAFNAMFLLYVALVVCSIYGLIFGTLKIDINRIRQQIGIKTPFRGVSAWMLFFAIFLGGMWVARSIAIIQTLPTLAAWQIPEQIAKFGIPTSIVFATDLSLLVPALFVSGIMLWKHQPWGFVMATIVLVKASTYGLALLAMTAYTFILSGTKDDLTGLWIFLTTGCLISCAFLVGNMRPAKSEATV